MNYKLGLRLLLRKGTEARNLRVSMRGSTVVRSLFWRTKRYHYHHQPRLKPSVIGDSSTTRPGLRNFITDTRWLSSQANSTQGDASVAWKRTGKEYNEGPDQILPSTALYTWLPDGAVRLDLESCGKRPESVPTFLKKWIEEHPNNLALAVKNDGVWRKWTYEQYYEEILLVSKAFLALGLERFHSVCILSFNRPEWFISNFAAILGGGFVVGIYGTNIPKAVAHCALDSRVSIFVVENAEQLAKVKEIRSELKTLKAIIMLEGEDPDTLSWQELLEIGKSESDSTLKARLKSMAVNQCCNIIYTSGTTGKPKGVMLSHDNITWTTDATATYHVDRAYPPELRFEQPKIISYLPLSHVAAQIMDLYTSLCYKDGIAIYFGDGNALKGSLVYTLREVRPTFFLGVPRVYEKIYERLMEVRASNGPVKNLIGDWAKGKAVEYNRLRMERVKDPQVPLFNLCDKHIFMKIKEQLGLDKSLYFMSGAAPLSRSILEYFLSLNIPIAQLYGLSESTGPSTCQYIGGFKIGSIGRALPGTKFYTINTDSDGDGELVIGGRCIMMGYVGREDKTIKVYTPEGHFRTGDLATIDEKGFVTLFGRQKEIIITAGGENISPTKIEDRVMSFLPIANNAVVIGEGQKCLTLLLTLRTEINQQTTEPLDTLIPFVQTWIEEKAGVNVKTVSEVLPLVAVGSNHTLRQVIQSIIDQANKHASSRAKLIRNWCLLPTDFSIPGGELGPTLKLRRDVVARKYEDTIKTLYSSSHTPKEE